MATGTEKQKGITTISNEIQFDPRETTLRDLVAMYSDASNHSNATRTDYRNFFEKNPEFEPYLDAPVVALFDPVEAIDNPLIALIERRKLSGTNLNKARTKIEAIEYNARARLQQILARDGQRLTDDDFFSLVSTVARQKTQTTGYKQSFTLTTPLGGDLQEKLVQHAKNNPDDLPVVNAIFLNMETGLRPSLIAGLETVSFHLAKDPRSPNGIGIAKGMTGNKMNEVFSVPLSERASQIIFDQSNWNEQKYPDKSMPHFFTKVDSDGNVVPITFEDMNKVLKANPVPGLLSKLGERGREIPVDSITSYDLRRYHATLHKKIGTDKNVSAQLAGRVLKGFGSQTRYEIGSAADIPFSFKVPVNAYSQELTGIWGYQTKGDEGYLPGDFQTLQVESVSSTPWQMISSDRTDLITLPLGENQRGSSGNVTRYISQPTSVVESGTTTPATGQAKKTKTKTDEEKPGLSTSDLVDLVDYFFMGEDEQLPAPKTPSSEPTPEGTAETPQAPFGASISEMAKTAYNVASKVGRGAGLLEDIQKEFTTVPQPGEQDTALSLMAKGVMYSQTGQWPQTETGLDLTGQVQELLKQKNNGEDSESDDLPLSP